MARSINRERMFSLTKYVPLTLLRSEGAGDWDDDSGLFTPAPTEEVIINANIQPLKFSQVQMMDSSERTKEWVNVWSTSEIRKMQEGENGWDSDYFNWNGNLFRVMEVQYYQMGVLDHWHARAALHSPTPREA